MKILIGVPSNDMIHAAMAMDLCNLVAYTISKGHEIAITNQNSSIIEVGRAQMVMSASSLGVDALFTVDSDMRFPANALVRMVNHDRDIVCCDAVRRRLPYSQVLETFEGKPIDHENVQPLIKVKGGTSAFMLTKMDVFHKTPMPHYKVAWHDEQDYEGEDYWFSNRVREAGFDIWCDTELSMYIGHIGCVTHYIPRPVSDDL